MRLRPDPEAAEFAAAVRGLLERACDSSALRAAWDSDDGRVPGLGKRLAELGVPGLTVGPEHGGGGADLTWALPVLVEVGRAAAPEPVLEALVAAAALGGSTGPLAREWLPRVADGSAVVGVGLSATGLVSAAEWADLLVLAGPDGAVYAVPREVARVVPAGSVDQGVRLARVGWSVGDGEPLPGVDVARVADVAATAAAAVLVGLSEAMLAKAVDYAGQREQFGRPIGAFQAVKHQLADAYVALAFAGPVVARAAWSVSRGVPSRSRDASHAKIAAGRAAGLVARTALQVHGGIGYTFEHDLHMWLKRTWTLRSLWGDEAAHQSAVEAAVLGDAPAPRLP